MVGSSRGGTSSIPPGAACARAMRGGRCWEWSTRFRSTRAPTASEEPGTVLYLDGQDAVFSALGRDQQWIYSFKQNTWAELPIASDGPIGFAGPYCQMVYVAKYGVLVNTGWASRGTSVMRPEVRRMQWD